MNEIKCGVRHNWIGTKCGKDYMFGNNGSHQCLEFRYDTFPRISTQHRIDEIVKTKCKIKSVIEVALGRDWTHIICKG